MKNTFDRVLEAHIPYGDNPFKFIDGKKLVFFDTETTGFNPRINQIIEIAAITVDGSTLQDVDQYHVKIELNRETLDAIQKEKPKKSGEMSISDILNMTKYNDKSDKMDERAAIEGFNNYIPDKAVMIAHNAKFDLKMINTRARKLGTSPLKRPYKVLDTMLMSRLFFVPLSQELEMDGDANATAQLDVLTKQWTKSGKRQKISSRLGDVSTALVGNIENWHTALGDVQTTINVFKKLKEFFNVNFDSNLKYNHDFIRRYKRAYAR